MTDGELAIRLEHFWELKEPAQREYYERRLFPPLKEAILSGDTKFIRQIIRVLKAKQKKAEGPLREEH